MILKLYDRVVPAMFRLGGPPVTIGQLTLLSAAILVLLFFAWTYFG